MTNCFHEHVNFIVMNSRGSRIPVINKTKVSVNHTLVTEHTNEMVSEKKERNIVLYVDNHQRVARMAHRNDGSIKTINPNGNFLS